LNLTHIIYYNKLVLINYVYRFFINYNRKYKQNYQKTIIANITQQSQKTLQIIKFTLIIAN